MRTMVGSQFRYSAKPLHTPAITLVWPLHKRFWFIANSPLRFTCTAPTVPDALPGAVLPFLFFLASEFVFRTVFQALDISTVQPDHDHGHHQRAQRVKRCMAAVGKQAICQREDRVAHRAGNTRQAHNAAHSHHNDKHD